MREEGLSVWVEILVFVGDCLRFISLCLGFLRRWGSGLHGVLRFPIENLGNDTFFRSSTDLPDGFEAQDCHAPLAMTSKREEIVAWARDDVVGTGVGLRLVLWSGRD